jgi:hypothetical protein
MNQRLAFVIHLSCAVVCSAGLLLEGGALWAICFGYNWFFAGLRGRNLFLSPGNR